MPPEDEGWGDEDTTDVSSSWNKPPLKEAVLFPSDTDIDFSLWNNNMTDLWPQYGKDLFIMFSNRYIVLYNKCQ